MVGTDVPAPLVEHGPELVAVAVETDRLEGHGGGDALGHLGQKFHDESPADAHAEHGEDRIGGPLVPHEGKTHRSDAHGGHR